MVVTAALLDIQEPALNDVSNVLMSLNLDFISFISSESLTLVIALVIPSSHGAKNSCEKKHHMCIITPIGIVGPLLLAGMKTTVMTRNGPSSGSQAVKDRLSKLACLRQKIKDQQFVVSVFFLE